MFHESRRKKQVGDILKTVAGPSVTATTKLLKDLDPAEFTDEKFGLPTVKDILAELEKPGRDPRPEFKTAALQEGVETMADLRPGMALEGTVTNVTNFGAFVDIGVHQDGLVHVSQLADRFIADPHQVVKAGDIVRVKVLEVDLKRKRIALTMRKDAEISRGRPAAGGKGPRHDSPRSSSPRDGAPRSSARPEKAGSDGNNAMAAALAAALNKRKK